MPIPARCLAQSLAHSWSGRRLWLLRAGVKSSNDAPILVEHQVWHKFTPVPYYTSETKYGHVNYRCLPCWSVVNHDLFFFRKKKYINQSGSLYYFPVSLCFGKVVASSSSHSSPSNSFLRVQVMTPPSPLLEEEITRNPNTSSAFKITQGC